MKVAELKQVVDANAGEMREGFAKVREQFAEVHEKFAEVRERFAKVDERFAKVDERFEAIDRRFDAVERRIDESARDTRHQLGVMIEDLLGRFTAFTENVEAMMDRKIAESELRAERKFVKR